MDRSSLISDLEKQFSENPRRVFARLANEYRKSGDSDRAIEMCRAHIPQQPGYISGHIVLGQALFDLGEMEDARQTFETALALDPENLIALRQMGDISRQRGETSAAQGWYQRLLDVDPQNEEISAIVASLSPPLSSGASTAPSAAADPMAGWGQVDVGAEIGKGAIATDNSATANDEPSVSNDSLELLESFADLTDSSTVTDPVAVPSDALAEHEPLDTFVSAANVELASSKETGAEDSGKLDSDLEMLDWGISSGSSALDLDSGFAIEGGSPSLDEQSARDFNEWSGNAAPEGESSSPESEHSTVLENSEVRTTDTVDLEDDSSKPKSMGLLQPNLDNAAASYPSEPAFGRTFEDTAQSSEEMPAAFVTETMAELYLQQGFREEALSVYRRLVQQNPDDAELRARVAQLEKGGAVSMSGLAQEEGGGEFVDRDQKPSTVKSFLAKLAARQPSRSHPPHPEERSDSGAVHVHSDSAATTATLALFGDEDAPLEDEKAAERLARAYTGKNLNEEGEARGQPSREASHGLSLDDVFRGAESRTEKTAPDSGFSFDEFFNDATDAERVRGSGDMADDGLRGREVSSRPESSDLESFNAWLEGLKK